MQTFGKGNRPNHKHGPPLVRAARNGDYVELEGALRMGLGNPNAPDALGKCPLVYAVEGGHQACAELLLRAGADPNHRGEVRSTRHALTGENESRSSDALRSCAGERVIPVSQHNTPRAMSKLLG